VGVARGGRLVVPPGPGGTTSAVSS
jgi:hypothetical protein